MRHSVPAWARLAFVLMPFFLPAAGDDAPPVSVDRPKVLHQVAPVYPPDALKARIQGVVRFSAVVDRDGNVESLRLVSGHPLLAPAARAAAIQWVFEPVRVRGERVRAACRIDVPFFLDPAGQPRPQEPEAARQERKT